MTFFFFLLNLFICNCIHVFTGGTNESDHSDSPSMRKCLRKTRGELLLREYEVRHVFSCLIVSQQ